MADSPRPLAVIDVDGVVADVRHRLHHLESRPKDWRAFLGKADRCPPLAAGVDRVRTLQADRDVVYLTGRPERLRHVTEAWLERQGSGGPPVLRRTRGDFRPARITKGEEIA